MDKPIRQDQETLLKGVRTNIVQSIRAFRVSDLQETAQGLGQHFLYANLSKAQSKQDGLDLIAAQFTLPTHFGKNFDALYDSMTDPVHKSGPQPGFIVVLEHIPANTKFDKENYIKYESYLLGKLTNSPAGKIVITYEYNLMEKISGFELLKEAYEGTLQMWRKRW